MNRFSLLRFLGELGIRMNRFLQRNILGELGIRTNCLCLVEFVMFLQCLYILRGLHR